jgi:hypothetical protein
VAGAADLLDLEKEHVTVTVCEPANHFLLVAAGFTFEPELLSRAAPIVHKAGLQGFLEGLVIHPGKHQHATVRNAAARSLLHDYRDKTFRGEFEIEFHCCRISDCRIIGNVA